MKNFALCITIIVSCLGSGCDVQSGITKKSVEKYEPTPTPEKTVTVVEQIDPADIVTVDTDLEGPKILINKSYAKTDIDCTKFNRVMVNVDAKEINIKGVCKQLMINGDKNQIVAVALTEIVLNGVENTVQYSKYANGKKPVIKDNGSGNTILKAETPALK